MLDLLLTPTVLACLLVAGCAAFAVSVFFRFIRDRDKLAHTMRRAEAALERLRHQIAEKQAMIAQLQEEVTVLKPLHDRLTGYYEQLTELRVEMEREEMKEDREKKKAEGEDDIFSPRRRPRI